MQRWNSRVNTLDGRSKLQVTRLIPESILMADYAKSCFAKQPRCDEGK
jgi:hypothetical protein